MVGPLYIDDDLEPKKFETLFKMPPGGARPPFWDPILEKCQKDNFKNWKRDQHGPWGARNWFQSRKNNTFGIRGTYGLWQIGRKGALHMWEARLIKKYSWLNFLSQKLPFFMAILKSASKMISGISRGRWRPFCHLKAHLKGFQTVYRAHILCEELKLKIVTTWKRFRGHSKILKSTNHGLIVL